MCEIPPAREGFCIAQQNSRTDLMNRQLIIVILSTLMVSTSIPSTGYAQIGAEDREEISVGFVVPEVGTILLPAYITADNHLYLPLAEVFAFLRIKVDSLSHDLRMSGYLFDERVTYRIDGTARRIELGGEGRVLNEKELMLADGRMYLRTDLFGTLFGLHCTFNFGDLEVRLSTDYDLPAVRQAKREGARRAMRKLYESESFQKEAADQGALLRLGVADWAVTGALDSLGTSSVAYAFTFGGEVLKGAFRVDIEGENDSIASLENIPWEWRYVDNDFAPARQITLGHVPSILPEPFAASGLGASVTNRSTITRTSYGAYIIQDQTEPEWDVELYVNDQLVDFTTADANGIYRFEIPFRYGSTPVTLRFFGPYGEERTMEKTLRIPLTMLPAGEVEYTVVGGLLEGEGSGLFVHAKGEVGLNSMLTLGGGVYGVQYNAPEMWYPYVVGSARLTNSLFLSGKYSPANGGEGSLNWITPMRGTVELGYRRGPRLFADNVGGEIRREIEERRSLSVSTPIPFGGTLQVRAVDNVMSFGHVVQGEGTLATRVLGIPLTVDMRGEWTKMTTWSLSTFTAGLRTLVRPWNIASVRPSIEFDMATRQITGGRLELERQVVNGLWANLTLTQDFRRTGTTTGTTAQIGLRLDLPFARTTSTARYENGGTSYTATASGSLAYDSQDGRFFAEDRTAIDRAALTVRPFLDLNANDTLDAGEPLVPELDVAVEGGTIRRSFSDSTIRVLGLEPYRARVLRVDESNLPEISWKPRYTTLKVMPRPNRFETIDIPLVVVGEASGTVLKGAEGKGMRGLLVRFRQLDGDFSDSTITYEGGEFYYMGLPPGRYSVAVDEEQMRILGLNPETTAIEFDVKPGREGDIVEGLALKVK